MSELKVDKISPALNSKITITPAVVVQDSVGVAQFEITSSGEIKILGPLRVGSFVSNTPGNSSHVLTSQGDGLPPVWAEGFPFGGIIMWYGFASTIPAGWKLCDGQTWFNYKTPDLRDRFVVGAGNTYSVNQTGGSKDAVVVSHTHSATSSNYGGFSLYAGDGANNATGKPNTTDESSVITNNFALHSHTITVNSTGESGVNKNLPPYYALCYIMRVPTS